MDVLKTNLMRVIEEEPEFVMALIAGNAECKRCIHHGECRMSEGSVTYIDCVKGNMEWLRQEATI